MKVEELGSLRLNIVYTEDHVFPSEHYTPLRDLLLHSANVGVRVRRTCVLFGFPAASVCVVCALVTLEIPNSWCLLSLLSSRCRRPQLTFWGRCVERNRKLLFPSCVSFFTTARSCLLSAPSLTLKSTAHSECRLVLSHFRCGSNTHNKLLFTNQ